MLALRIVPLPMALRFVVARLPRLRGRFAALFLALVALLPARGATFVLVIVVAALLRECGRDAAHGEQGAKQGGGQGAGCGQAVHL